MRSPQKQSADQGVRNGEFMEAIIALDEVDENLALYLLNLIPARRAASDTICCTSRGSGARWVRLPNRNERSHRPPWPAQMCWGPDTLIHLCTHS
jgi:hypothetical protein